MARINSYDFMNLLEAFDQSLIILVKLLDEKKPELAKDRARRMRDAINKLRKHKNGDDPVHLHKGHGPHGAIV